MRFSAHTALALFSLTTSSHALPAHSNSTNHDSSEPSTIAIDQSPYSTSLWAVDGLPCSTLVTISFPTTSTTSTTPVILASDTTSTSLYTSVYLVDSTPCSTVVTLSSAPYTVTLAAAVNFITLPELETASTTDEVQTAFTIYTINPTTTDMSTTPVDFTYIPIITTQTQNLVSEFQVTTVTLYISTPSSALDEYITLAPPLSTPTEMSTTPLFTYVPVITTQTENLVSDFQFTTVTLSTRTSSYSLVEGITLTPPVPSAYTVNAPTTTDINTRACNTPSSVPYIEGSLVDGQPEWNICIPGETAPWSVVSVGGGIPDNWSVRKATWAVDGQESDFGSVQMTKSSFQMDYGAYVQGDSVLALIIAAQGSNNGPFDITVTVSIETLDEKRAKRDTLTFELSDTIVSNASSIDSSSEISSTVSSSADSSSSSASSGTSAVDYSSSSTSSISVATSASSSIAPTSSSSSSSYSSSSSSYSESASSVPDTTTVSSSFISTDSTISSHEIVTTIFSDVLSSSTVLSFLGPQSSDLSASIAASELSKTSTYTADVISTTIITVSSCGNISCVPEVLTTGLIVITTTESGVKIEYTTYCPLTTSTTVSATTGTSTSTVTPLLPDISKSTSNITAKTSSRNQSATSSSGSKATTTVVTPHIALYTSTVANGAAYTSTITTILYSTALVGSGSSIALAKSSAPSSIIISLQEGSAASPTNGWTLTFGSLLISLFMMF